MNLIPEIHQSKYFKHNVYGDRFRDIKNIICEVSMRSTKLAKLYYIENAYHKYMSSFSEKKVTDPGISMLYKSNEGIYTIRNLNEIGIKRPSSFYNKQGEFIYITHELNLYTSTYDLSTRHSVTSYIGYSENRLIDIKVFGLIENIDVPKLQPRMKEFNMIIGLIK